MPDEDKLAALQQAMDRLSPGKILELFAFALMSEEEKDADLRRCSKDARANGICGEVNRNEANGKSYICTKQIEHIGGHEAEAFGEGIVHSWQ